MVAAVPDLAGVEHNYTSGVIASAPEDGPTDPRVEAALDKFEQTGTGKARLDIYAKTFIVAA